MAPGSSRGFGRALVPAALEVGDLVAATARRPEQLADLSAEYGDSIRPITIDVTDPAAAASAIAGARDRFGVIVNTADADFRAPSTRRGRGTACCWPSCTAPNAGQPWAPARGPRDAAPRRGARGDGPDPAAPMSAPDLGAGS